MRKYIRGINRYFIRILLSFLLLVLVPVSVMGGVWYKMAKKQEFRYKVERQSEKMDAIGLEFERRIRSVEVDLAVFKYSKAFQKLAQNMTERSIYEVKEEIKGLKKKNQIFTSLYIYDTRNDKIYNSSSGIYNMSDFYDVQWVEEIENDVQLKRLPPRKSLNEDLYKKAIGTDLERIYPCRMYLSILSQKIFDVYLLANIDVKKLGEYIQTIYPLDGEKQECSYLILEDRQILYSSDYQNNKEEFDEDISQAIDGEKGFWRNDGKIYFIEETSYDKMYYVESYLEENFFKSQSDIRGFIIGVCVLLSIFLTVLAYILSRRLYQPISNLYGTVKRTSVISKENMRNDLDILQKAFLEMSKHYESAIKEEKSYQEFRRMSSLRMVLTGIFRQEKFFEENNQIYSNKTQSYQLLVFELLNKKGMAEDAYENFCFRLKSVINSYLQVISKGIFTEVEETCFAIFYTIESKSDEEYTKHFLIEAVNQLVGIENYFVASPIISQEDSIKEVYKICREKISNALFFESPYGEILEIEKKDYGVITDIAINYEKDLIRAIITRDQKEVEEVLISLYNKIVRNYEADFAINLCSRVMVTLDKEFGFYKLLGCDVQEKCLLQKTLKELLEYMHAILTQIIERMGIDYSAENKYCKEAKRYLEENYMKDINMTEVADHLGISYAYLSKIFKTQPEGNGKLSDYLNIIRINKSKDYLKESSLTLTEIAEKVGYNNVQSFQRFFKKYENMTPGEFKKYLYHLEQ